MIGERIFILLVIKTRISKESPPVQHIIISFEVEIILLLYAYLLFEKGLCEILGVLNYKCHV